MREAKVKQARHDHMPCAVVSKTMTRLGLHAQDHQLSAALMDGGPEHIIYCRKCGGMAEVFAAKLATGSCTAPSGYGKRVLRRIAEGMHPVRNAALSNTWDLCGKGTANMAANEAWADMRRGEVEEDRPEEE